MRRPSPPRTQARQQFLVAPSRTRSTTLVATWPMGNGPPAVRSLAATLAPAPRAASEEHPLPAAACCAAWQQAACLRTAVAGLCMHASAACALHPHCLPAMTTAAAGMLLCRTQSLDVEHRNKRLLAEVGCGTARRSKGCHFRDSNFQPSSRWVQHQGDACQSVVAAAGLARRTNWKGSGPAAASLCHAPARAPQCPPAPP